MKYLDKLQTFRITEPKQKKLRFKYWSVNGVLIPKKEFKELVTNCFDALLEARAVYETNEGGFNPLDTSKIDKAIESIKRMCDDPICRECDDPITEDDKRWCGKDTDICRECQAERNGWNL